MGLSFTPTASTTIIRGFKDPTLMIPIFEANASLGYDHDDAQVNSSQSTFWDRVNELGQSTTSNFVADTFQTIVDTTSGHRGQCFWIVGPATPSTNVTITIRITLDGDTSTWAGVVATTGDRAALIASFANDLTGFDAHSGNNWDNSGDGLLAGATANGLPGPNECLRQGGPLIFDSQLKIEMKSSAGITTAIEKNAGALVAFWDDGWS